VAPEVYDAYAARKHESGLKITYTNAVDVWSFGILLQQLLEGLQTYLSRTQRSLPFVPPRAHLEPQTLVQQMLLKDPELRPSATECVQHRWFSDPGLNITRNKRGQSPFSDAPATLEVQKTKRAKQLVGENDKMPSNQMMADAIFDAGDKNHSCNKTYFLEGDSEKPKAPETQIQLTDIVDTAGSVRRGVSQSQIIDSVEVVLRAAKQTELSTDIVGFPAEVEVAALATHEQAHSSAPYISLMCQMRYLRRCLDRIRVARV
jgi:serine/threonine protein kinase